MVVHAVTREIVGSQETVTSRLRLNKTLGWEHVVIRHLKAFPTYIIVGHKLAEADEWLMGSPRPSWRVPSVSTQIWVLCEARRARTVEEIQAERERIDKAQQVLDEAQQEIARILYPGECERNKRPRLADQTDCSICLESLSTESKTMRCGHSFHSDCLVDWFLTRSRVTCPTCRS
jgi:hypothetical protein